MGEAEVMAWLHAHPDAAVRIMDALLVARPRYTGGGLHTRPSIRTPRVAACVVRYPAGWMYEDREGQRVMRATAEEAHADADAELRGRGWALAGRPT